MAACILLSRPETGKHSHLFGSALVVACIGMMYATMSHWAKYLRVLFGGGILSSLIALGSGHLPNRDPFPRPIAAMVLALFLAYTALAGAVGRRHLTMFDRVALTCFVAATVVGLAGLITKPTTPTSGAVWLGVGFVCLLATWVRDRFHSTVANGVHH